MPGAFLFCPLDTYAILPRNSGSIVAPKGVRAITEDEVRERLRAEAQALGGQKQLAAQLGASEQYVSDVLAGRRKPGKRILAGLNLRRREVYEAGSGDYSEA